MLRTLSLLTVALTFSTVASAREGRGEHETKVVCNSIKSLVDAKECFKRVGAAMPSENDANAVRVTARAKAKALLIEMLVEQKMSSDITAVKAAGYVAAIVQNDDEASIYYYALTNGTNVKPKQVGRSVAVVDLQYEVCPIDGVTSFNPKFGKVANLLLGMGERENVAGTVWLDDAICE